MKLLVCFFFIISAVTCQQVTMIKPTLITDPQTSTSTTNTTPKTTTVTTTKSTVFTTSKTTPVPTPPTPRPDPLDTVYYVNDSNTVCLLFSVKIKFNIGNAYQENTTKKFDVKVIDSFEGVCGNTEERITLHFFKDWSLTVKANKIDNTTYYLSLVQLKYNTSSAPVPLPIEHFGAAILTNLTDYSNSFGLEYMCRSGLKLNDTLPQWNYTLNVLLDDFKVEAFRNSTTKVFNANGIKNCEADNFYNNLIPIIVGGLLVALIVVVLIAYLISRKSRRSGYESV